MALTDLETDRTDVFPITQILAANQLGEKLTLASALYLPHPKEFEPGSFPLPWNERHDLCRRRVAAAGGRHLPPTFGGVLHPLHPRVGARTPGGLAA
jgi:hypothetical protein